MNKLILIFLFVSGLLLGQEKVLFKTISYNNLIKIYNTILGIENEDLEGNIERCRFIIKDAEHKDDYNTALAFNFLLKGLTDANSTNDKNQAFLTIYQESDYYIFYDSQNNFIARMEKLKLEEQISIHSDKTETYIWNYFYMMQD